MLNIPESAQEYVNQIFTLCGQHGVRVNWIDAPSVEFSPNMFTSGYFDEETLTVAIGKPVNEWLQVFVHESCHLQQYLFNKPLWSKKTVGVDPCLAMDWWLEKDKEYTKPQLKAIFDAVTMLERDCEQKAVQVIKNYNLPIGVTDYIKRANSYLFFYHLVRDYRKWYNKQPPYRSEEIVKLMPGHAILNRHVLPKNIMKIFHKECYK
jgi:hypothetical protein